MTFGEFIGMIFSGNNIAAFGAAFAAIMACIGSARGVGIAGEAASGVLAEEFFNLLLACCYCINCTN